MQPFPNSQGRDFAARYLNMAKHKSGGKITANHSSLIDAAFPVVEAAEKLPEVSKISLGFIKTTGKSRGIIRMKFSPIGGGWKITVRGSSTVQEIFIYTSDADETKTLLQSRFD